MREKAVSWVERKSFFSFSYSLKVLLQSLPFTTGEAEVGGAEKFAERNGMWKFISRVHAYFHKKNKNIRQINIEIEINFSRIAIQQDLAKCPPPFPFSSFLSYQISVHFLFLLLCRDFFIASSPKNREKERSLKVLEKKNPIFLFLHTFSS